MTDSPNPPDPRVGTVIQDRYKILAVVASGGMGAVYRGERLQLGRPVAIKFLHPWIASEPSFLQRFDVEARAMSRLNHPNCISVIDFGVDDVPFLVMDFVAGHSLRYIIENERLTPTRVLGFARQILSGLAHAHTQGIVHRDLKPENIVVSDTPGLVDHVRILDFGLAKLHDGPALTVGMAVGTPSYMAPEQTLVEGIVDVRTDIYAVGLLLFEMLTGRKPFVSDNVGNLILMHQRQPAPRLQAVEHGASFSDALESLVAKALAKAPADRFLSADEMAESLEQVPESTAMHLANSDTLPVSVHPQSKPPAAEAATNPVNDETLVDTRPQRPGAPVPQPPPKASTPNWKRFVRPFWNQLGRRRWWVTATTAAAALVIILVWVLLRAHQTAHPARVRPPVSAPTVAATQGAVVDDLGAMTLDNTPGVADAAQLVRLGLHDQAITVLQEIRRNYPRSSHANFLLAVAYFEKLWWSVGLQHAQAAIQIDPAYRRSPKLARLLIHSLISDSFWEKGAAFLEQEMAEISSRYLEEAAQFHKSPRIRARAAQVLATSARRAAATSSSR